MHNFFTIRKLVSKKIGVWRQDPWIMKPVSTWAIEPVVFVTRKELRRYFETRLKLRDSLVIGNRTSTFDSDRHLLKENRQADDGRMSIMRFLFACMRIYRNALKAMVRQNKKFFAYKINQLELIFGPFSHIHLDLTSKLNHANPTAVLNNKHNITIKCHKDKMIISNYWWQTPTVFKTFGRLCIYK